MTIYCLFYRYFYMTEKDKLFRTIRIILWILVVALLLPFIGLVLMYLIGDPA